jgi:hypothetical protein
MPVLQLYHPQGALAGERKAALAAKLTDILLTMEGNAVNLAWKLALAGPGWPLRRCSTVTAPSDPESTTENVRC